MVNKEKTIDKAISKYHLIFPIRGKHSIEECFFCWRGEYYLLFKTKDKKFHFMKAELYRPSIIASPYLNRDFFFSVYKALNKPIIVRSLFIKNSDHSQPWVSPPFINGELFSSIYKVLNKPIIIRIPVHQKFLERVSVFK